MNGNFNVIFGLMAVSLLLLNNYIIMECCRVRHLSLLVERLGEAGSRGGCVVHG